MLDFGKVLLSSFGSRASEEIEKFLIGKAWTTELMGGLYKFLEKEFNLDPNAPGGMISYRKTLVLSFYYKYFLHTAQALGLPLDPRLASAVHPHERPVSNGEQHYQPLPYEYGSLAFALLILTFRATEPKRPPWESPSLTCLALNKSLAKLFT